MNFASDNTAGVAPEVMEAIAAANSGNAPSYGGDDLTKRVERRFAEIFARECAVYFVATGGAANGLALSAIAPPWGMILCHEQAHVQMDECAGPELLTGGAKLLPVSGEHGKLTPAGVAAALAGFPDRRPHGAPAAVLTLTQASEVGTVYTPDEMAALAGAAKASGLSVHVDGARFANALAALGCAPADISWRAGVDILSFGATKNGCLAAEAVVIFNEKNAADFDYRRKRAGQLISKHRFLAAQFDAYFEGGLWLRLAARANAMARRLADGLEAVDGVKIWHPVEANAVFASFPPEMERRLLDAGAKFYPWIAPGDPAGGAMRRLVASFATRETEVDEFIAVARGQKR